MTFKVGDKVLATIGHFNSDTVYKWYPATVIAVCSGELALRFPDGISWAYSRVKQRDDGDLGLFPCEWIRPLFMKNSLEATE